MSRKPEILIHTALFSEAKPIIAHLALRQYETRPYKIFRGTAPGGGGIVLIVSGVGSDNCRSALEQLFTNHNSGKFKMALNIGTAGCNNPDIPQGSLFCTHGEISGLPSLPLITSDIPVTNLDKQDDCLVDMEASTFLEVSGSHLPTENLYVLKVVSDYLDDSIKTSAELVRLIERSIHRWESILDDYPEKMESVIAQSPFENLPEVDRKTIRVSALRYRYSYQELKQIIEMALDFRMWDEIPISECLQSDFKNGKEAFRFVRVAWENLKQTPKSYSRFKGSSDIGDSSGKSIVSISRDMPGFGRCPVASDRTRCCNLLTLDAVEGCGYDCSYCSIRYFYDGDSIGIDENFIEKLQSIEIDPRRNYHIGTGQSSDSLMWGNRSGILDAVLDFAAVHPNVILELKTKSANISHLLSREVPVNVLTTWSLNPQLIIDNEEHFTASLTHRLEAAEQIAAKGNLIGFHFHPMVYYDTWEKDYGALFSQIQNRFRDEDTALLSLGTLTFIKPVLKKMRERKVKSKILQMPLEDAEGKYSYPLDIKRNMFRFAYESLSDWHGKVFFYMCMEDAGLWKDVFGYEYSNNEEFESAMIAAYEEKIREKRNTHR